MRSNKTAAGRGRYAPSTITEAVDWRELAECRPGNGVDDDEIWYPNSGRPDPDIETTLQARGICAGCPVKTQCLEDALASEGSLPASLRHGIRAGTTGAERNSIYRSRNRNQHEETA